MTDPCRVSRGDLTCHRPTGHEGEHCDVLRGLLWRDGASDLRAQRDGERIAFEATIICTSPGYNITVTW